MKQIKLMRGHLILNLIPLAAFDPMKFDNPMDFNPNRFDPDNIRSQLSWLPFGAGPHVCPGQFFAWALFQVFILQLVDKFNIELLQSDTKIQEKQGLTLRVPPIHIKLIDRY